MKTTLRSMVIKFSLAQWPRQIYLPKWNKLFCSQTNSTTSVCYGGVCKFGNFLTMPCDNDTLSEVCKAKTRVGNISALLPHTHVHTLSISSISHKTFNIISFHLNIPLIKQWMKMFGCIFLALCCLVLRLNLVKKWSVSMHQKLCNAFEVNRHSKRLKGEHVGAQMDYKNERDEKAVCKNQQYDNKIKMTITESGFCGAMWWWNDAFNHIDDKAIWLHGWNVVHLFHFV